MDIFSLAKIEVEKKERENLKKDFQKIVKFFDLLKKAEIKEKENFYLPWLKGEFREDKIKEFQEKDLILKNFPEKEGKYLKAKKVL